jgi:NAD(P)-dependent dehydrogenase (short-subunit alcohol dehydrogenase family)
MSVTISPPLAGRIAIVTGGAASLGHLRRQRVGWEFGEQGIRVNCVAPALSKASGMQGEMPEWFTRDSVNRIPMGRVARAEEVANVVACVLSDEASFVTGDCYGGRASL